MDVTLLFSVVVVLLVVGLLLWAANNFIPMDERINKLLNVVVVVGAVLYVCYILLSLIGWV